MASVSPITVSAGTYRRSIPSPTELFDAALVDGQGDAFWATPYHSGTKPAATERPAAEAPTDDINSRRVLLAVTYGAVF